MKLEELKKNGEFINGEYVLDLQNNYFITYNPAEKLFYIKDKDMNIIKGPQGEIKYHNVNYLSDKNKNLLVVTHKNYPYPYNFLNVFNCQKNKFIFNDFQNSISELGNNQDYLIGLNKPNKEIVSIDGNQIFVVNHSTRDFKIFENNPNLLFYTVDKPHNDISYQVYNIKNKTITELLGSLAYSKKFYIFNKKGNLIKTEDEISSCIYNKFYNQLYDLETGEALKIPQYSTNLEWLNDNETLLKVGKDKGVIFDTCYGVYDYKKNKMILDTDYCEIRWFDKEHTLILLCDEMKNFGIYSVDKYQFILPCEYKNITQTEDNNIKATRKLKERKSLFDAEFFTKEGKKIEKYNHKRALRNNSVEKQR